MDAGQADDTRLSPFVRFSREEWSRLLATTSFSVSEDDVRDLRQISEHLPLQEATEVYLPLSWLLHFHVRATRNLYRAAHAFLAKEETEVPYVVGIAGSVAGGKSTVAQVLRALISRWPGHPKVELAFTDGFLYPTPIHLLAEKGSSRKPAASAFRLSEQRFKPVRTPSWMTA